MHWMALGFGIWEFLGVIFWPAFLIAYRQGLLSTLRCIWYIPWVYSWGAWEHRTMDGDLEGTWTIHGYLTNLFPTLGTKLQCAWPHLLTRRIILHAQYIFGIHPSIPLRSDTTLGSLLQQALVVAGQIMAQGFTGLITAARRLLSQ